VKILIYTTSEILVSLMVFLNSIVIFIIISQAIHVKRLIC